MMQNKDLLTVSIFTLITVISWIVFNVYHAAVTSTISEVQQQLITPLDPTLDTATIQNVRTRIEEFKQ